MTLEYRLGDVADRLAEIPDGSIDLIAQAVGRHAIGIDLDSRNADLARDRVGMFMTIVEASNREAV
jgi:hypothetical protein